MGNPNDPNAGDISRVGNEGPEGARGPNAGSRPEFERGEQRVQTDDAPGHEARSFQTPTGAAEETDDPPEDHYEPSSIEVTRGREQGLGLGARDLQLQRDPHRPVAPANEEDREDGE